MKLNTLTLKAFRDTSIRILKKLTVVLLGVVAFFSLRALENAKTNYEKESAQPIVIVDVDPGQTDTNQEFVVKLESSALENKLKTIIDPSEQDLITRKQKEYPDRFSPGLIALESLSESIKNSIRDVRRTPFENQEKFVEYLAGRIHSGKDAADKQLSDTKAKRIKWFDELAAKFAKRPPRDFEAALKDGSDKGFNEKFEAAKELKEESALSDELGLEGVVAVAKKVEQDRDLEDHKRVSDAGYRNMDRLHSTFVPEFLTPYVRTQRNKSPHPSSVSEMVLDERRGGHVVYQVFYLAFICVLVFGVLFPIYLLLRLFPAFSSGVEPLKDQATGLLTRRGAAAVAAPALMKTLALSATALGVGAAVVIANNPVTAPKSTVDAAIASSQNDPGNSSKAAGTPGGRPTASPTTPPAGETATSTPTPLEGSSQERPINFYPEFKPTFTLDYGRIAKLEGDYLATNNKLEALDGRKLDTQVFKDQTAAFVTDKQFAQQVGDLPIIRNDVRDLKRGVAELVTREIPDLRTDIKTSEANLTTRLDANTAALTGFREGTQGRSVLSRARELLGRERYQVTPASYQIVHDLICKQTDCSRFPEQVLLNNLRNLRSEGRSMDKKTLQKKLGIGRQRQISATPWEALILRYSRVPY